jgi:hypothetical protein
MDNVLLNVLLGVYKIIQNVYIVIRIVRLVILQHNLIVNHVILGPTYKMAVVWLIVEIIIIKITLLKNVIHVIMVV